MSAPYPWQEDAWGGLAARREAGRLPHALLLHGAPGMGKEAFALHLAAALLCRAPAAEAPCGACPECALVAAGTHPDRLVVTPPEDRRSIGIDAIRALAEHLSLTAGRGGAKPVVLVPAERMTPEAANSLLKTLEEPPPGTVLLLVSHAPGLLLPTLRSRCQAVAFPPASAAAAGDWLRGQGGADLDAALLLGLASGRPLAALGLAKERGLIARERVLGDLEALLGGGRGPVTVAQGWAELGVEAAAGWNAVIAQDMLRLRLGADGGALRCRDLAPRLAALSKRVREPLLLDVYDQCLAVRDVLARQLNLTPASLLERIALGWAGVAPSLTPWR